MPSATTQQASPAPGETTGRSPKKTGRPPLTDAHTLLEAAHDIGFDRLTVGEVTAKVGVKYSTFYRHYPSLADLQAALLQHVLDQRDLAWPTEHGCRAHLQALAQVLRAVTCAWPGFSKTLRVVAAAPQLGPPLALRQAAGRAVAVLVDHSYPPGLAVRIVRALIRAATADPDDQEPYAAADLTGLAGDGAVDALAAPASPAGSGAVAGPRPDDDALILALMLDGLPAHAPSVITAHGGG